MRTISNRINIFHRHFDLNPIKKIHLTTTKKKTTRKKTAKKTITKEVVYKVPKILLKKDGYELIITEKPQAALKISSALIENVCNTSMIN